jgi:sugar (pentulose or hexulose) kinase
VLPGRVIVLDVGKTLAKLSLWDAQGRLLEQRARPNYRSLAAAGYRALDTEGIEAWVADVLVEFAKLGPVAAIVPVGHGAAAAVIRDGRLACAVPDYEDKPPPAMRARYDQDRDAFALTGSPALPCGLNLGVQLHWLESQWPDLLSGDALILPWPQFWAWKLSGVAVSEISSFGCHSDLWMPLAGRPSSLAQQRGWAARFAPLRHARDVIGTLSAQWSARTGLSSEVQILCGLHDSNAALLAARGHAEIAGHEATVVSTGTWFVAMRLPATGAKLEIASLPERRDCLMNLDVDAGLVPSARFMGGRELEVLGGIGETDQQAAALDAIPSLLARDVMALPNWAPGVGPYPAHRGRWLVEPASASERCAAAGLYAALMTDVLLELIDARECLLIEGRFAQCDVYVRALATLRPDCSVYVGGAHDGVAYGALRLLAASLQPVMSLQKAVPLPVDLSAYKARWRASAERPQ